MTEEPKGWVKANPKQLSRLNRATRGDSVFVYMYIVMYSRSLGYCWSSLSTIAEELAISRKSVQRSIKKLSEVGAIVIDAESKITNCYTPVDLSNLDLRPKIIGANLMGNTKGFSSLPRTKPSPGRNRPDPQDETDLTPRTKPTYNKELIDIEVIDKEVYTLQPTSEGDSRTISKPKKKSATKSLNVKTAPTPNRYLPYAKPNTPEWIAGKKDDVYAEFPEGHPWFGFGRFWCQFLALKFRPTGSWTEALESYSKIPSNVKARSKVYNAAASYLKKCYENDGYHKHASTWLNQYRKAGFRDTIDVDVKEKPNSSGQPHRLSPDALKKVG